MNLGPPTQSESAAAIVPPSRIHSAGLPNSKRSECCSFQRQGYRLTHTLHLSRSVRTGLLCRTIARRKTQTPRWRADWRARRTRGTIVGSIGCVMSERRSRVLLMPFQRVRTAQLRDQTLHQFILHLGIPLRLTNPNRHLGTGQPHRHLRIVMVPHDRTPAFPRVNVTPSESTEADFTVRFGGADKVDVF